MKLIKSLLLSLFLATPAFAQSSYTLTDPFLYKNITSNTTTTVKSGPGVLHTFCINTKGATANTATVYDNTSGSGTKIATIDTTTGGTNICEIFDAAFTVGLTVVTASGTSADITVSYK